MDGRFMMPHHKKKAMVRRLIYRGQGRAFSISAFKTSRSTSFIIPLVFFKKDTPKLYKYVSADDSIFFFPVGSSNEWFTSCSVQAVLSVTYGLTHA